MLPPVPEFSEVLDGFMDMSDEEISQKVINDSLIHVDFMVGSDDLHIVGIHERRKRDRCL